jgi:hypothetical protein
LLTAVLLGFALGVRHAADPDHLAAIAALVARHRSPAAAARIGAAWGLGHSLMIFAVGGTFVAFRITAVPSWARAADLAVAAILVTLGISNLRSLRRQQPTAPPPPRQADRVEHPASGASGAARSEAKPSEVNRRATAQQPTAPAASEATQSLGVSPQGAESAAQRGGAERRSSGRATAEQPDSRVFLRSLGIGMAHGLAGSAAVALLALAAMPSPRAALAYLVVFGLGTVGSMVAMSLGLGVPASRAGARPTLARWVVAGSGALSIGVGIYLALTEGVASSFL